MTASPDPSAARGAQSAATPDVLLLEGLEVPCRVGCTAAERATPQSLRVDLKLHCASLQRAGRDDDLSATVDYRIVSDMIAAVQGSEYLLFERVAEVIAAVALAHPLVQAVELTLRKRPPVQSLEFAGLRIFRTRPL